MKTILAALTAIALTAGVAHAQDQWYDRQNEIGIHDRSSGSHASVDVGGAAGFTREHGQALLPQTGFRLGGANEAQAVLSGAGTTSDSRAPSNRP